MNTPVDNDVTKPLKAVPAFKDAKTAALIIVGLEILSGRTQDTNTNWIAERLTSRGIALGEVRIIPDDEYVIGKTAKELSASFDYVFSTGGIGPTHDDITAESMAKAFGKKLEKNEEALSMLLEHYGEEDLTDARAKMALIPEGAELIPNPVSAAPGFVLDNIFVMAGVPRIMQAMFDHIIETIDAGKPILSNTVACSLQESVVAEDIATLQVNFPDVLIGSYPHYRGGILGLSIVMRSLNEENLKSVTNDVIEIISKYGDEPRALSMQSV
jgi:molybdenum cofactor synthesis domain-containing protein